MFSLVIPSYNNSEYLKLTINSIKKTSTFDNEILVHVNDDKDNKTREFLRNLDIDFTYSKENIGLCSSINTISKKASFDYIIYSHDDMYFCPDWEKPLLFEINKLNHKKFYFSGSMIEANSGHIMFDCGQDICNFDENKLLNLCPCLYIQ